MAGKGEIWRNVYVGMWKVIHTHPHCMVDEKR